MQLTNRFVVFVVFLLGFQLASRELKWLVITLYQSLSGITMGHPQLYFGAKMRYLKNY